MKKLIRDTLSDESQPSSKRLAGMLGWIVCIFCSLYCVFTKQEAPDIVELLFYTSASLLGLDSVVSVFKERKNKKHE